MCYVIHSPGKDYPIHTKNLVVLPSLGRSRSIVMLQLSVDICYVREWSSQKKRISHAISHITKKKEVPMNPSELSIFIFGIYLIVVAAGFLIIPNAILPMFKMPKTQEQWIRVMAVVIGVLAYYYIVAAMNSLTPIFWATVYGRFGVLAAFVGLEEDLNCL